ncbi:cation:proton antiporter [Mucilaginibacter sp.]|uniref:cation:proton antiporter n=1 Tax=Mucilaginibacter sp. TaxID=1882438 RepID=UPI003B008FAE
MDNFTIITILVVVSAVFSYINARFFKLPGAIGVISIAVVVSVVAIFTGEVFPVLFKSITGLNKNINFSQTLLNTMLGFLLFASALRFDWAELKKQVWPVFALSTIGVFLSTLIFGVLFYWLTNGLKLNIPFKYCLLFGALISPTDPVAVSAVLKNSKIPEHLNTIIKGESLFNDGVGIILFLSILEFITQNEEKINTMEIASLFAREVFGGIVLGGVSAFIISKMMKKIEDFQTLVIISLALVMGISVVANKYHLSIPLAVVSAGLIIGNLRFGKDPSGKMNEFLEKFWTLIDDLMNTVLFVMIGLQIVMMPFLTYYWFVCLIGIFIILFSRVLSVLVPVVFLRRTLNLNYNYIGILTWAGVRGGISIALALSLPKSQYKEVIEAACYFIVIFSVVVQGLTLNKVSNYFVNNKPFHLPAEE